MGASMFITTARGQGDAGAVVNVLANPPLRNRYLGERLCLHLDENAHEFRLTPWTNDPVSDLGGEAFYIRDEESGQFWSPTPLPSMGIDSLRQPARIRLQCFRACRARHPLRAVDLCGSKRPDQVHGVEMRTSPADPAVSQLRATWNAVLGDFAAQNLQCM